MIRKFGFFLANLVVSAIFFVIYLCVMAVMFGLLPGACPRSVEGDFVRLGIALLPLALICRRRLTCGSPMRWKPISSQRAGHEFESTNKELLMVSTYPQPFAVPAGSGKQFKFMGVVHKLTQPQTGGAFYLFEAGI